MYSFTDLRKLRRKPRINDISLKVLQDYYEAFLYPFIYTYKIDGSDEQFKLRFDKENFCHLLGIESIVKYSIPYQKRKNYKGEKGWKRISNGKITFALLKSINRRRFLNHKAKFVYFYVLPDLIDSPFAIKYDKDKVTPSTDIECTFLFYSNVENAIIHLGVEQRSEEADNTFFPKTFFVEKISNDISDDKYLREQEHIHVDVQERVITL